MFGLFGCFEHFPLEIPSNALISFSILLHNELLCLSARWNRHKFPWSSVDCEVIWCFSFFACFVRIVGCAKTTWHFYRLKQVLRLRNNKWHLSTVHFKMYFERRTSSNAQSSFAYHFRIFRCGNVEKVKSKLLFTWLKCEGIHAWSTHNRDEFSFPRKIWTLWLKFAVAVRMVRWQVSLLSQFNCSLSFDSDDLWLDLSHRFASQSQPVQRAHERIQHSKESDNLIARIRRHEFKQTLIFSINNNKCHWIFFRWILDRRWWFGLIKFIQRIPSN